MSKNCCNFARFFESAVHSYIGITPDFGSEKRGSTPWWTTKGNPLPAPPHKGGHLVKRGTCDGIRAASRQLITTAPY